MRTSWATPFGYIPVSEGRKTTYRAVVCVSGYTRVLKRRIKLPSMAEQYSRRAAIRYTGWCEVAAGTWLST